MESILFISRLSYFAQMPLDEKMLDQDSPLALN